jgi:predicted enzyme related to lactoylglutathione lyase
MGQPVVHFEIEGKDGESLKNFYSELFGWDTTAAPNNSTYGLVQRDRRLCEQCARAPVVNLAGAFAGRRL